MSILVATIDRLNETMGKTIGRLENLAAQGEAAQKATLSLGMSLGGGFNSLGGSIDELNGSVGERLQVGIAGLKEGLQGNTTGLLKLLNEQQLLGLNFRATAKTFALLEASLGLSREETVSLAGVLSETSKRYAVSTDKLVGSLDALQSNMPALRSAGLGGLAEVQAQLAGKLGPAMIPSLNKFMSFISDTSMDTFSKLSLLGIGDLREQLSSTKDNPEKQMAIFVKAIREAGVQVNLLAGDTEEFYTGFSIATDAIGNVAMSIKDISENLDKRKATLNENTGIFTSLFSVIKNDIFAPFNQLFLEEIFPKLTEVGILLRDAILPIVSTTVEKLREFIDKNFGNNNFKAFAQNVINIGVEIANFSIKFINMSLSIGIRLFNAAKPIFFVLGNLAKGFISLFDIVQRIVSISTIGVLGKISSFFTGDPQLGQFQFDLLDRADFQLDNISLLSDIKKNTKESVEVGKVRQNELTASMKLLDETIRVIADEATNRVLLEAIAENTEITAEEAKNPTPTRAPSKIGIYEFMDEFGGK